jgi:hypothetical protein
MRPSQESVSLAQAMWRGFRMRCPHCGQGTLFGRFLKVADHCPKCDEELSHHCADDFPAYLVIAALVLKYRHASVCRPRSQNRSDDKRRKSAVTGDNTNATMTSGRRRPNMAKSPFANSDQSP